MTTQRVPTRATEKIQRRREARRARLDQTRRGKQGNRRGLAIAGALAAFGLAVIAWFMFGQSNPTLSDVRTFPDQGRDHIQEGQAHPAYNSTPPTSGPHYANWEMKGVHKQPIKDEIQVHNLEHGDIVIQYNCSDCPDIVAKLESYGRERQILVAPYPTMTSRIALTAWGKMLTLDQPDDSKIRAFIDAYRNKGPEVLADNMR